MSYGQQAYRDACQFCRGRGCFDCDMKGKRAMEASFANPIAFKTDSPEDMAKLKDAFVEILKPRTQEERIKAAEADLIEALRKCTRATETEEATQ